MHASTSDEGKKTLVRMTTSKIQLPNDLILEILSWLPPETLSRAICKSWYTTTFAPKFKQLHKSHYGAIPQNGRIVIPTLAMPVASHPCHPNWLKFAIYHHHHNAIDTPPRRCHSSIILRPYRV